MKIFLSISLILTGLISGQTGSVSGTVYDSDSGLPLPYVSMGIQKKAIGTIGDKEGRFNLRLTEDILSTDTVVFSHVGYQTLKMSLSDLELLSFVVRMTPEIYNMDEIVISTNKAKRQILGRNHVGLGMMSYNFYHVQNINKAERLSKEVGTLFTLKNDCAVKSVNFHIASNEFEHVKFRLSFYSVEDGLPHEIIVHKNILFDIREKYRGWFSLDLTPYDITIPKQNKIAVTLTLLEDELDNERNWFTLSAALLPNHTVISRENMTDEWESSNVAISFYLDITAYQEQ